MPPQQSSSQPLTINHGVATYNVSQNIGASKLIPDSWNEIVIKDGATLKGNFIVRSERTKPLLIRGESKTGSVIEGLGSHKRDGPDGGRAFYHSAVYYGGAKAVITIENLTSKNPDFYHLLSGGKIIANNVRLITTSVPLRKDRFSEGDESVIRNSSISTTSDVIKIYSDDMIVENVTIEHLRNGTLIQLDLTGQNKGSATVKNLTVITASDSLYNMAAISRTRNTSGGFDERTLTY